VFFSLFIIKIPKSSKRWSIEKREREKVLKKEEGKRKGSKSLCKNTCKTDEWTKTQFMSSQAFHRTP
jgi:hypothetical protein